ncbi:hypothetical protein K474DRAFT_1625296 [Panus rudis PR-1116 ss-1]|nr:hypothetical protein K474DRAFT_1625296 [Panus rudis PR-1116 ss-1]
MGSKPRQFTRVLARAQDMLRGTFGMELVEMVARVDLEPAAKDDAASQKKKATPAGTRSYILRSALDPTLISKACAQNTALLQVEQSERVLLQDVEDENTIGTRSVGSILAWQYADQLGSIGILHVILALILVNGRAISDSDLWTLLKRLRLQPNSTIPLSSQTTHQSVTTEAFLTQLIRQGYLDHRRIGEQKGGAGKKRGRIVAATQATNGEEENNYEWRWGPRAMSEVGEVGISRFVAEFIVNQKRHRNEEDEYEEESEMDASAKKQFEKLIQGVEKAAGGGQLVDITGK